MSITVKPNNTQIEQVHGFKKENANTIFSQGLYNAKGIPSSEHGYRGNQVTSFNDIVQNSSKFSQDTKKKVKELSDQAIKDLPGIKGQNGEMLPKDWESYLAPRLKEIGITYDQYKKIIEPTNFDSMFKAIQEKAQHDETYKKNIMELARKGIMPAEISQYDAFWGCGINGNGCNHLGILSA